jgi:hypothetical protein
MRRWKIMQILAVDRSESVKNELGVKNSYINALGKDETYNGWDTSNYHEIPADCKKLLTGQYPIKYGAFYDKDKVLIKSIRQDGFTALAEFPILSVMEIPVNAKYFRDSDTAAEMVKKWFILTT